MKKKRQLELSEGPSPFRRQHAPFVREILTPAGAPIVARHRTRPILTPLDMRRAIIEETQGKPEATRIRSLRRRLTALDRALSDEEAEILDRICSCLASLSNIGAVNYLRSEVRTAHTSGCLPFTEARRREIEAANIVLKRLDREARRALLDLAALLDPSAGGGPFKPDEQFIARAKRAAMAAANIVSRLHRSRREDSEKAAGCGQR